MTTRRFFKLINFENSEPVGVERRYVPHLKALICGYLEPEVQGRGSTFTVCYVLLNIGVFHETRVRYGHLSCLFLQKKSIHTNFYQWPCR